jgi:hypothetical protein
MHTYTAEIREGVYNMCKTIHASVFVMSNKFLAELGRHNHVTPTSYLELLNTYRNLYGTKRTQVQTAKRRLEVGLEKLKSTESVVSVMKDELTELQPVLVTKGREVEELMQVCVHVCIPEIMSVYTYISIHLHTHTVYHPERCHSESQPHAHIHMYTSAHIFTCG